MLLGGKLVYIRWHSRCQCVIWWEKEGSLRPPKEMEMGGVFLLIDFKLLEAVQQSDVRLIPRTSLSSWRVG